jgi:hypothetical protein
MDPSAAVSKPVEGDRVDVAVGVGVVEHRRGGIRQNLRVLDDASSVLAWIGRRVSNADARI